METDDKIFKELLKEGLLTKAPESFTENVMSSVKSLETEKKGVYDFSSVSYFFFVFAALLLTLGIFYFLNPSFIYGIKNYSLIFLSSILTPFSGILNSIASWHVNYTASNLVFGTLFIILSLLAFDRIVLGRKRYMNLFV